MLLRDGTTGTLTSPLRGGRGVVVTSGLSLPPKVLSITIGYRPVVSKGVREISQHPVSEMVEIVKTIDQEVVRSV